MKNISLIILLACGSIFAQAQQREYTISGYVKDSRTAEPLIGVAVTTDDNRGTNTNTYGFYSFNTQDKDAEITFSYLGYDSQTKGLELTSDMVIDIEMLSSTIEIGDVVIESELQKLAQVKTYGSVTLNAEQLKYIPAFMGEQDIFKFFQLQPGVSPGKEGSSGLNLRGGSSDQTLILMDDIPIYNHSHAFGFVSIFSGEFIKSAELFKGYVPANYGGRLSGVATMNMREGNRNEHKQSLQLGTTTASALFEGPINGGKGSYLVGGRYFTPNLLLSVANLFTSDDMVKPNLGFYDITAKMSYDLGSKHTIYANFYTGRDAINFTFEDKGDDYNFESTSGLSWGNMVGSVRLSSKLSNKLFMNTTAYYSHLSNSKISHDEDFISNEFQKATTKSTMGELGLKILFQQNVNSWYNLSYGLDVANQEFTPQDITYKRNNGNSNIKYGDRSMISATLFVDNKFTFNKFDVNLGARLSLYNNSSESVVVVEPRLSVNYKMAKSSLWLSYVQNTQPLFSMNQVYYALPIDYWIPFQSSDELPRSHQLALGYKYNFDSGLELFAEVYNKRSRNLSLIYNPDDFLLGEGGYDLATNNSYGAEFMAQYKKGRFNFMGSYTYSKSEYDIDGRKVNFAYDTPHNLNLFGSYETLRRANRKHTLSMNANYKTGLPYIVSNELYPSIGSPNGWGDASLSNNPRYANKRLNNFFRVDLNYSMEKKMKNGTRTWQLSLLNATAHRNPYIVYYNESRETYSAFCLIPFLPSFSYKRTF